MSAFLKFNIEPANDESYEDFRKRCLDMLGQVILLSDSELLNLSPKELTALHSMNYSRYLAIRNPSFPQDFVNVGAGDIFSVPFYKVFPREMCNEYWSPSEWDRAEIGASRTEGPIEVKLIDHRKLIVVDGHNRLKDAIASGQELITVKVKSLLHRDCLVTKQEALQILSDFNLSPQERELAEEIIAIWDTPMA